MITEWQDQLARAWISPEGRVHKVNYGFMDTHAAWANRNRKKVPGAKDLPSSREVRGHMARTGWVQKQSPEYYRFDKESSVRLAVEHSRRYHPEIRSIKVARIGEPGAAWRSIPVAKSSMSEAKGWGRSVAGMTSDAAWISPNGEVLPVEMTHLHATTSPEIPKRHKVFHKDGRVDRWSTHDRMLDLGWVKKQGPTHYECREDRVDAAHQHWLDNHKDKPDWQDEDDASVVSRAKGGERTLMQLKRDGSRTVVESVLEGWRARVFDSDRDFEYSNERGWITPDDQLHKIGMTTHARWASANRDMIDPAHQGSRNGVFNGFRSRLPMTKGGWIRKLHATLYDAHPDHFGRVAAHVRKHHPNVKVVQVMHGTPAEYDRDPDSPKAFGRATLAKLDVATGTVIDPERKSDVKPFESRADALIYSILSEGSYHQKLARKVRKALRLYRHDTGKRTEIPRKPGEERTVLRGRQMSHRLHTDCQHCDRRVPVGRLRQHMMGSHREEYDAHEKEWAAQGGGASFAAKLDSHPWSGLTRGYYDHVARSLQGRAMFLWKSKRGAGGGNVDARTLKFPKLAQGSHTHTVSAPNGTDTLDYGIHLNQSEPKENARTMVTTRPTGGPRQRKVAYLAQSEGNCGQIAPALAARHGASVMDAPTMRRLEADILERHKNRLSLAKKIGDNAKEGGHPLVMQFLDDNEHLINSSFSPDGAAHGRMTSPTDLLRSEANTAHIRTTRYKSEDGMPHEDALRLFGGHLDLKARSMAHEAGENSYPSSEPEAGYKGHHIVVSANFVQNPQTGEPELPKAPGPRGERGRYHVYYEHPTHGGLNYGATKQSGYRVIGRIPLETSVQGPHTLDRKKHGCFVCRAGPGQDCDSVEHEWKESKRGPRT